MFITDLESIVPWRIVGCGDIDRARYIMSNHGIRNGRGWSGAVGEKDFEAIPCQNLRRGGSEIFGPESLIVSDDECLILPGLLQHVLRETVGTSSHRFKGVRIGDACAPAVGAKVDCS